MSNQSIPTHIIVRCGRCGHRYEVAVADLADVQLAIYRETSQTAETTERYIPCPNCDNMNVVRVPKEWLDA